MPINEAVVRSFEQMFNATPQFLVRAPGRVNLIGEHTDYNEGFVMPLAIDRASWIALSPRADRRVVIHSLDFEQTLEFGLDDFSKDDHTWLEYVKGVAWALQEDGLTLTGWQGVMKGDVPIGAGLSSSAGLELGAARAFACVSGFEWDPVRMAKLSQRAENQWVGVNCGIMDQLISATGRQGHVVLIDCRSLEPTPVPLPEGTAIAVLDTATRRGLESSAYNERRAQCEAAAALFGVHYLRDVSVEQFEARQSELEPLTAQRARHVVTENARTLAAAQALRRGDAQAVGELMVQSHVSLRDDFEVSCPELNAMADAALRHPACYGARMTGAGFGGCATALIRAGQAEQFAAFVEKEYTAATGLKPNIYISQATDGARVIEENTPATAL